MSSFLSFFMFVDLVLGRVLLDSEEARMVVEERLEAGPGPGLVTPVLRDPVLDRGVNILQCKEIIMDIKIRRI